MARNGTHCCRLLHPGVRRQLRCNWHLLFVIKGDRWRSFSPQGGQHKQGRTSRSHSYFLLLPHICGSSPWEFSLAVSPSPYLLFPNTALSPSLFLGESVVPSRFVPPLRWHPFSEGDFIVLLLTNLCYPMCQRILKTVNDCMRIYNEKICTMVKMCKSCRQE